MGFPLVPRKQERQPQIGLNTLKAESLLASYVRADAWHACNVANALAESQFKRRKEKLSSVVLL